MNEQITYLWERYAKQLRSGNNCCQDAERAACSLRDGELGDKVSLRQPVPCPTGTVWPRWIEPGPLTAFSNSLRKDRWSTSTRIHPTAEEGDRKRAGNMATSVSNWSLSRVAGVWAWAKDWQTCKGLKRRAGPWVVLEEGPSEGWVGSVPSGPWQIELTMYCT